MTKARTSKKSRVVRTRNGGKWTEAEFWGAVRSALRAKFRFWFPAQQAMDVASRPYKGTNKRRKKEVRCAICGGWFPPSNIEKDHKVPCGSLKKPEDLAGFLERLCPEDPEAFQMLCPDCHNTKTQEEKKLRKQHKEAS